MKKNSGKAFHEDDMRYFSTRGDVKNISFQDAVMMGMAEDGGLLLPDSYPKIDIQSLKGKPYTDVAYAVLSGFVGDIPAAEFKELINKSYAAFTDPKIVPLVNINECSLAELFHGPTFAFKDVALQLLGNLFEYILSRRNEQLNILGATSGDTGSAAIAGVRGKENLTISILYPDGRVSPVQERQMATVPDANVHTYAVDGTFDDCQNIVKTLFADVPFKREKHLGAVNSINWARIMAQIVYYFYAYIQLGTDEKVNFVVPTGNFGNIFAGWCAKEMGLPVEKLVIATNENDILHRFVANGDYSLAGVVPTYSPSMDIQISSNLERYLYYMYGGSDKLKNVMQELKLDGKIQFSDGELKAMRAVFDSYAVSNKATEEAIKRIYDKAGYVMDPHTACGVEAAFRLGLAPEKTIVMATAHPAKFPDVVKKVLGFEPEQPAAIKALADLPMRRTNAPNDADWFKFHLMYIMRP